MKHHHVYIAVIGLLFAGLAVVLVALPRSTFSELERRELATFPDFNFDDLKSGEWTSDVSAWFSDTEPYRDLFMTLHLKIKDNMGIKMGADGEEFTFHASDTPSAQGATADAGGAAASTAGGAEEITKIANNGIIVVGSGSNVRALMAFGGVPGGGVGYAMTANKLKEAFGPGVNVYCMVIPTAADFYAPEKTRGKALPQKPVLDGIYAKLGNVKAVDVWTPLSQHTNEDIYLRTDHHWAPLGAYYAAQQFAKVAGVPFKTLDNYDRHVVHGFVGTMYGYSKDIAVKNAPEDFVYYTPRGVDYTTTYTYFKTDKDFHVIGEGGTTTGAFFHDFSRTPGGAYSTFMGGDAMIVKVKTSTHNGRKLAIIKDSYGNAIPGYLFHSFEEIHVIDYRYFPRNLTRYVQNNGITDFLMANNIFVAYGGGGQIRELLTRGDKIIPPAPTDEQKKPENPTESAPAEPAPTAPAPEPTTAPEPAPTPDE